MAVLCGRLFSIPLFISLGLLSLAALVAAPGTLSADMVWSPDERLTNDPFISRTPAVTADPSGNVHVVWMDQRDGPYGEIYRKRWDGISWTPDERLTYDPSFSDWPAVAADPSGNVHVIWRDYRGGNYEIYYKRWNGVSWTPDERLTNNVWDSDNPAMTADPSGNVHVVWRDDRGGNSEIYYKRWDGGSWTPDERLTNDSGTSADPAVAADPSGNVHVVWRDDRRGNYEIYYKRWDGVSWTSDERLVSNPSEYPAVAADQSGNVHVVWRDGRGGNSEIYYKRWAGGSWTPDERLTGASNAWFLTVTADPSGKVHVVWHDDPDGNYEIYYKRGEPSTNLPPVCDTGGPYVAGLNVPIVFDGTSSTDPDGAIVSYEWAFGDGSTGSGPTSTHAYAAPNLYTVSLTVTDNGGRAAGCSTTANIANEAPACDPGGPYAGAVGEPVLFDGTNSTDPDGTIVSYEWAFGDGATTCGERPWHEYSAVGSYTVTLCVTDNHDARSCCSTEAAIAVAGIRDGSPALSLTAPVLKQSSPNPFNPATSIAFALPTRSWTTLTVFDAAGRLVAQPFDRLAEAGEYEIVWDGRGEDGAQQPSGVYFYRLESGGRSLTGRMVMVK